MPNEESVNMLELKSLKPSRFSSLSMRSKSGGRSAKMSKGKAEFGSIVSCRSVEFEIAVGIEVEVAMARDSTRSR